MSFVREGEVRVSFHRIDSKHHMTRFHYCLDSRHQACSESRSYIVKETLRGMGLGMYRTEVQTENPGFSYSHSCGRSSQL